MNRSDSRQRGSWKPDPSHSLPLYRQIEVYISEKITAGEWTAGYRLPSQRTLAQSMGVNRSTLVTALENLAAAGMIEGRHGGGTYVCGSGWHALAHGAMPNWEEAIEEGWYYPNLPEVQQINRAEFQPDIIRLGTGELAPDLMPQEAFNDILLALSSRSRTLNYLEPQGSLELRQALSVYLQASGIQASADSILIVSGSLQALHLISVGLLPRGSAVLLEKPSYLYSIHAFQSAGLKMSGIPMDAEGLHTPRLEDAVQNNANRDSISLLYTIPSFHNPTGSVMSDSRREEILATARNTDISILEDAAYSDLWLDELPPPALKARDKEGRVLHMGTLSKAVSPGLRLGWLVGPEPVIRRLADIKMQTDYGTSSLAQEAAALWFADGYHEQHMDRLRPELRRRRDFMIQLLQRDFAKLAEWSIPAGGFYIWLRFTVSPLSIRELFHACLENHVLIHPGYLYDRLDAEHIRLSYAYASPDEMERGLHLLAQTVKKLMTS
ncbi:MULTISPECIES: aminotransferase-like domain-containing protein [unclassified Paenibacillus]|uniref:aminotransferase-like domain-containing protein n=1 Tax=unclassified Paenibacillus TaxID=185978 RepID=UPI0009A8F28A|nr:MULTISPECIES: PLP-dependent aminotransferase family protein [unclassified Paenibacillus]SLK06660.1 transcriptional regulator, GntR family [Paenibacillus sp. RU5A]SOC70609.1 transcriptional regulator, GntR family [Paenibacillus sp. RU26A]SOC72718.1 transcriptional regulator, GntR family [Paenibacillus sp. RU5M]